MIDQHNAADTVRLQEENARLTLERSAESRYAQELKASLAEERALADSLAQQLATVLDLYAELCESEFSRGPSGPTWTEAQAEWERWRAARGHHQYDGGDGA